MTATNVNRRKAVYAALRFERTEPCPYYIWIDDRMSAFVAQVYGEESLLGAPGATPPAGSRRAARRRACAGAGRSEGSRSPGR